MLLLKIAGYGALAMAALAIVLAVVEAFIPYMGASAVLFAAGAGLLGVSRAIELLAGIKQSLIQHDQPGGEEPRAEATANLLSLEELEAKIARVKAR